MQIQTGVHRLCIAANFPTDVYAGNADIFVQLRALNTSTGAIQIMDEMSLIHRLEIESADKGEGSFEYTKEEDGSYTVKGSFLVGRDGTLVLRNGAYLSLDMRAYQTLNYFEVSSIDHWAVTNTAVRIDPFIVNGVTKDIDLTGVIALAIRPDKIKTLEVTQNGRVVPFTSGELYQLALQNNDIVSIDRRAGTAVYGVKMFSVLGVHEATFAKYTPASTDVVNLAQYLVRNLTIA